MISEYLKKTPRMISDVKILISSYLQKELARVGCVGIVPSHGEILFNLFQNEEMTMTELSNEISKDRSTVTALVAKLIKKEMVIYVENPEDMRSKKVRLTDKGNLFRREFVNISNNMDEKLWNNISKDEKETFIKVMLKMKDNFTNME